MKPDVLVVSLGGSLVESLVPDESTVEELLLPSLSAAVLSPDAPSTASSEVSDVSGTVEAPGGCWEEVAGTEGVVGTAVFVEGLTEVPTLGVAEGTTLGATSLPLGALDWDEQPANPRVATDNSNTDV